MAHGGLVTLIPVLDKYVYSFGGYDESNHYTCDENKLFIQRIDIELNDEWKVLKLKGNFIKASISFKVVLLNNIDSDVRFLILGG